MNRSQPTLSLFYSYAHEDAAFRKELEQHLALLKRQGLISVWHDRNIEPGRNWANEIDEHLESADIILLLVSPAFLASDYCYEKEMCRALERNDDPNDAARVVPVILRPCDWQSAPFGRLQALPSKVASISSGNHDEAFLEVVQAIRRLAGAEQSRASSMKPDDNPTPRKRNPRAILARGSQQMVILNEMTAQLRLERNVYVGLITISALLVLGTSLSVFLSGQIGSPEVSVGLFGVGGLAVMVGRLMELWKRALLILNDKPTSELQI